MGDPAAATKALKKYSQPMIMDIQSSIFRPSIADNTFEIKSGTIQMVHNSVQFWGAPTEDPNMHIRDFIKICDTFKNALTQFAQQSGESICEAWELYKEILRKCPHHGMLDQMIINCFYNGLGAQSRPILDATSGGTLWAKSYEEAYELIEMMAANEYQNPT
ncbi:uncharacterized protein LOC141685326 [Apium graveolens]|uniref:uncharacterized protein LOC141685326 n=1 Tax=Apium graveolens TaxID=4045 RepID=UPI003D78BF94